MGFSTDRSPLLARSFMVALLLLLLVGCAGRQDPMPTVPYVDLDRFMGDWYVIANIPTFLEVGAHNSVESYQRGRENEIATRFSFRDGSFDGEKKEYFPTGFVTDDASNAVWRMQFVWPIKADYRIVYLDERYTQTIIGRQARDYVWIMARTPTISKADYQRLLDRVEALDYDPALVQRVPQHWPE